MTPNGVTESRPTASLRGTIRAAAASLSAAAVFTVGSGTQAQEQRATRIGPVPQERATSTSPKVLDESLVVRCTSQDTLLECDSEIQLTVANPKSSPVRMTFEVDPLGRRFEVNGAPVSLSTPEGELVQVGEAELYASPRPSSLSLTIPSAFRIDAGTTAATIFTPILVTRHPLLHSHPGRPLGAELTLQSVGMYKRWQGVEHTRTVLQYPGNWRWVPTGGDTREPPDCPPSETEVRAASAAEGECKRALPGGDRQILWNWARATGQQEAFVGTVAVAPPTGHLFNGGFLLGAGWGGGGGCRWCWEAVRLRAGYEVGVDSWGLIAVVGEFSPGDRLTVIPSLDFAIIPNLRLVPAITLGLGVPVAITPDARVGGRLQVSLTWASISFASTGLVFVLDIFPRSNGSLTESGGVAVQVGF